jgi:hypothetical protein
MINWNLKMNLLFLNIFDPNFPSTTRGLIKISVRVTVLLDSESFTSPRWKSLLFRLEEPT